MKIYPDTSPKWLWLLKEKEASENLSDICARQKQRDIRKNISEVLSR